MILPPESPEIIEFRCNVCGKKTNSKAVNFTVNCPSVFNVARMHVFAG